MARIVRERISGLCQRFRIEPNAGGLVSCKQLVWGSGIWCVLDISIDVLHKDKLLTCIHRHVSGYGVVPVIFNIRDSMAEKQYIGRSTQIGLGMVYFGYLFISNGVRVLFSPTHSFDGDVLQALPATWIALVVRLLMTFVVAVTAPLIVVPCGELIEGKLGLETTGPIYKRIVIRVLLCVVCTILSEFVPGFVHIISFVGCFCVSMAGFVLPPLFCLQLSSKSKSQERLGDVALLVLGTMTTIITSAMTFSDLMKLHSTVSKG